MQLLETFNHNKWSKSSQQRPDKSISTYGEGRYIAACLRPLQIVIISVTCAGLCDLDIFVAHVYTHGYLHVLLILIGIVCHCVLYISISTKSNWSIWLRASYNCFAFWLNKVCPITNRTVKIWLTVQPTLSQKHCKPIDWYLDIMKRQLWPLTCTILPVKSVFVWKFQKASIKQNWW